MIERLLHERIELLAFSLDACHFHVLARFPDRSPRRHIGRAKQFASFKLVKKHGLSAPIFAKRCRCLPVNDRAHQVNVFNYILRHGERPPCFVWEFKHGANMQ